MAAARIGKKVAVVVKMSPRDEAILDPMRRLGIATFIIPARATSYMQVIHPSADVDDRRMVLKANAGRLTIDEFPPIETARLHLAGISDQEFDLPLISALLARGYDLSVDLQSFVRQVDPVTREVFFRDVPAKRDLVRGMSRIKLDVVEARLLTGRDSLEQAAIDFESWGAPEVVITEARGVLARAAGRTYYEPFSNANTSGRTGRGDTTFAGYLARRMDHGVQDALRFAAAMVSIKMETPGPFAGTLDDVLRRLRAQHSG
jgi:sugar/nucleoside kinase (ribokinase family)